MKFKKLNSFLTDIDIEEQDPKKIQASFKRAEKYLHRRVIHYLENNNEKDLANYGNKLLNLLVSASDTINTATNDEIEYALENVQSKIKRFDKRMRSIIITPTVPSNEVKSVKDVGWRKFTRDMKPTLPLRKDLEILRVPIVFVSVKTNLSWNKKAREIRNKGLNFDVYDRYAVLRDQYVLFIQKDFPPLVDYIESETHPKINEDDSRFYKTERNNEWRKMGYVERVNEFIFWLPNLKSLRPINYGYPDGNMMPISYKRYYAQWHLTPDKQRLVTQYFGKVKSWIIADGNIR